MIRNSKENVDIRQITNKESNIMLIGFFLPFVFYIWAYPTIHINVMNAINKNIYSTGIFITHVATLIINCLWLKFSKRLYKTTLVFLILETIIYTIFIIYTIISNNFFVYYICEILLVNVITSNILNSFSKFKAHGFTGKQREKFSFKYKICYSVGSLVGSILSLITNIKVDIILIIFLIGLYIDNIILFIVIFNNMNKGHKYVD